MKVNLQELAAKISEAHPKAPQPLLTQVLRTTLKTLRHEIESVNEGALNVVGLGVFRVRNVESEKDGVKSTVRRTMFTVPRAAAAKAEGDAAAE
jgi:hypothetical protein